MIIDAHTHVASHDLATYPTRPTGVGTMWWKDDPTDVSGLAAVMAQSHVDRAVLVQAVGAYGFDNRYLLDAASSDPDRFCAIVCVDCADPDTACSELMRLAQHPGVRGVRIFAVTAEDPTWLHDDRQQAIWETASALGLTIVLTAWTRQLHAFTSLVEGCRTPVALDHCAFPDVNDGGRVAPMAPLFELAALPNCSLKVSSHLLLDAAAHGDPAGLVEQLAGAFGSERLIWGSDFPQTQELTYGEMLALGQRAAAPLDKAGRTQFFGANARALWFAADDPR